MWELDALEGTLAELNGYPILVVPSKVPASPPVALVQRLESILSGAGDVPQTDVISFYRGWAAASCEVPLPATTPSRTAWVSRDIGTSLWVDS